MKKSALFAAACLGAAMMVTGASAQDASAPPAFGQVRLAEGFEDDPHLVELFAGGGIDASTLGNGCVGMIASAPDYRLTYTTSGSLPLYIAAVSEGDTTLVINGPDGRWYCDDDSFEDFDPIVAFTNPRSGVYDIWVGTFGDPLQAVLAISEVME